MQGRSKGFRKDRALLLTCIERSGTGRTGSLIRRFLVRASGALPPHTHLSGAALAAGAPAFQPALHPDLLFLDQPGRTLVRRAGTAAAWIGACLSLDVLKTALANWIEVWNDNALPFAWAKTADQIIDRVLRLSAQRHESDALP